MKLEFIDLPDFFTLYNFMPDVVAEEYAYYHGIVIGRNKSAGLYRAKLTTGTTVVGGISYVKEEKSRDYLENVYLPLRERTAIYRELNRYYSDMDEEMYQWF